MGIGLSLMGCAGSPQLAQPLQGDLSSDSAITTCFSPDEKCDEQLISFIRSAKKSIDIAIFSLTHPQIVHEILMASRRIPVRVLVDRRQSKERHSLVSTLIKAQVPARSGYQRGIMHHKFVIVDKDKLETGSFNFTHGASFKNQENQIYIWKSEVVSQYQSRFDKMWHEARVF
ncbi:DUF1669 domain-containing protein [bacterium]|nr:DUF1669 domain-containing protein [bacterium]NBX83239.1 DUF1669 domain-containing protein [bacterium]